MDGTVRKRIRFKGWVQGVGFRYRAEHAAALEGVTGWVRNEYDGSVTMEVQGTKEAIGRTVDAIARGTWVRIEDMEIRDLPTDPEERSFRVR